MKKLLLILLILSVFIGLVSCFTDNSDNDVKFSQGLYFALNSDKNSYTVTGIGICSDTKIVIPDTYNGLPVTSIETGAFKGCDWIISMVIPNSVTCIGEYAFMDCTSITSIEIPDYVMSIGIMVFFNCSSLTSIEIPDSVTSIGDYAFSSCSSLTSIEIPDSVTSIG